MLCKYITYTHTHTCIHKRACSHSLEWHYERQSADNGPTPSQQCFLWPNKIIKRLWGCFPLSQPLFELGWCWMQPRRRQTWQCERQQSGARHHFTPVLQFTVQSASLKENILEWWEGLPIRVPNTKGVSLAPDGVSDKMAEDGMCGKVSPRREVHSE